MDKLDEVLRFLCNVPHRVINHQPARTSEESAAERGESVEIGAKALVVKVNQCFKLLVISGDRKLETKRVKNLFESKSFRFATVEELLELTGLVPGAVPPLGPVLGLEMLIDRSLFRNKEMAFNAGRLDVSIKMQVKDFVTLVKPRIEDFSK
jgi:Ala-tRNA(Pro) deacylase